MAKIRLLVLFLTFLVVGIVGTIAYLYASGYRLNPQTRTIDPNGLLVLKSVPDGAQIFVNGELKTATNATIPLAPAIYDISIKKEGFIEWKKRLTIEAEVVTEATAHLFKTAPSLSAISFSGITNPAASPTLGKIAYIVLPSDANGATQGLWIMETINLPLGFAREPRRITDANLPQVGIVWSPDEREILIIGTKSMYRLDTGTFTPQDRLVNVLNQKEVILEKWAEDAQKRMDDKVRLLPDAMQDIMIRKASQLMFSPDDEMVVYTASSSAEIPENLARQLPGSSTQGQERNIKDGSTYVYDIEEDRNFLITEDGVIFSGWVDYSNLPSTIYDLRSTSLAWYPSSRHIIIAEDGPSAQAGKITILDYDGTNRQIVYSGSYVAPYAFPVQSLDRLLILTNLGADSSVPNLYSLSLK